MVRAYTLTIYRLFLLFGFSPSSIFPFLLLSRSMESTIAQSLLYSLIVTSQKPFKERSTNVQMYFYNLNHFLLLSFTQEHNVDYFLPIFHNQICYLILIKYKVEKNVTSNTFFYSQKTIDLRSTQNASAWDFQRKRFRFVAFPFALNGSKINSSSSSRHFMFCLAVRREWDLLGTRRNDLSKL